MSFKLYPKFYDTLRNWRVLGGSSQSGKHPYAFTNHWSNLLGYPSTPFPHFHPSFCPSYCHLLELLQNILRHLRWHSVNRGRFVKRPKTTHHNSKECTSLEETIYTWPVGYSKRTSTLIRPAMQLRYTRVEMVQNVAWNETSGYTNHRINLANQLRCWIASKQLGHLHVQSLCEIPLNRLAYKQELIIDYYKPQHPNTLWVCAWTPKAPPFQRPLRSQKGLLKILED